MPKKDNFISVIIPAYNEEKCIKKCIESLRTQSINNYEIIVINDGSTDGTKEIIKQFSVNLQTRKHTGPGNAKNFGGKIAKGNILVFLDADMYIDKYYLNEITKPIIKKKCIATFTTNEFVANDNNIWSRCWSINMGLNNKKRVSLSDKTIGFAFRAIDKDYFIHSGGFNPKWGYADDRSILNTKSIACSADKAICYHYNPDSLNEVFLSSRWIGRSVDFKLSFKSLIRYSIINSIIISISKIRSGAPKRFIIFKIVFDLGILIGIIFKNPIFDYSK